VTQGWSSHSSITASEVDTSRTTRGPDLPAPEVNCPRKYSVEEESRELVTEDSA